MFAQFPKDVAQGLLTVIGQAGRSLAESAESEEPEEVSQPPRESRPEARGQDVPRGEPSAESADEPQGDLAARRLFALVERANQGKVVEPSSAEPPPAAEASSPPAESLPVVARWEPVQPERFAVPQAESPESPGVPEPNPCCLAFAGAEEPARQLTRWLRVQLASAPPGRPEECSGKD